MIKFFKKIVKFLLSRLFIITLLLFLQLALLITVIFVIGFRGVVYYIVFNIIGGLFAFTILNRDFNPAYKISWIIAILAVPFVGVIFYAMFGRIKMSKKTIARIEKIKEEKQRFYLENPGFKDFDNDDHQKIYNYLINTTTMPEWQNT